MRVSIHRLVSNVVAAAFFVAGVALGTGGERALAAQQTAGPGPDPSTDLTFTRDIAPILQENCQVCHQSGAIGPMSLMTYQDARRAYRRASW